MDEYGIGDLVVDFSALILTMWFLFCVFPFLVM